MKKILSLSIVLMLLLVGCDEASVQEFEKNAKDYEENVNESVKEYSDTIKSEIDNIKSEIDESVGTSIPIDLGNSEKEHENKKSLSAGQSNALRSAQSYLSYSAFSHEGLIKQLEFEGYSNEDATYAADNCGADWNEQATKCAASYLDYTAFSEKGLIEQLEFEGFTTEEAEYGAANALNSNNTKSEKNGMSVGQENALKAAQNYLSISAFSYKGLISQLQFEGYSDEDCTYAADNCGADWDEQAAKCAKNYLDLSAFSRQELLDQLIYEGFTNSQAEYGVKAVGY